MPSTVVKLCSGDARAWRVNQPVWLNEDGTTERAVLPEEQAAISACLARTSHVEQSFRQELELKKAVPQTRGQGAARKREREPNVRALFAFEVVWLGNRRAVNVYLGTLRYATGREVLSARLLADHGECILHGPNGKCMGVLRDPLLHERPAVVGRRVQWSKNPEEEERQQQRRLELEAREAEREARRRGRRAAFTAPERPVAARSGPRPVEPAVYSPETCPNDCRGRRGGKAWALPKGVQSLPAQEHSPLCMHAEAWAATLPPDPDRLVIYDIERSLVMRDALPTEIEEAQAALATSSMAQVQLEGRVFGVLRAADAEQAAREARGETDEPSEPAGSAEPSPSEDDLPSEQLRQEWPMLSELAPTITGRHVQKRDTVTAGDYLAHRAPPGAQAAAPASGGR